jgi:hypothetical protein
MSCGKRLAKRSIIGTRVCAPIDGHYYSGLIESTKTSSVDSRETLYCVRFDNLFNGRRISYDYKALQLIGPGFQSISIANLNRGQKIFITYNGREVSGIVDSHNLTTDDVFLTIDNGFNHNSIINQTIQVRRRLDEVRLFESRKSARLQESDTDYSRLASDGQTDQIRRRTSSISSSVSNSSMSSHIDVPNVQNGRKRRPSNSSDDIMDDCMAAMVLMSLSCSPKSPRLPEAIIYQCTWPGCLHQCDHCHQIEKHVRTQHLGRTDLNEECSDHEEEFYYTEIEIDDNSFGSSGSNSSVSPAPQSPSASNDGSTMSGSQSPIPNKFFPSSSAPTFSIFKDHEYEKRSDNCDLEMNALNVNNNTNNKLSNNSNSVINNNIKGKQKSLLSNPINIPLNGISSSHTHQYATSAPPVSLQSPRANYKYMRLNSNNKSGTTLLQSPNKNSPSKRGRGESRKCRKVYGMDNRDSWCTQCKWKKACSRFTD